MPVVSTDCVTPVPPGTHPDHSRENALLRLTDLVARTGLAAERHAYLTEHTQYLFPFESVDLFGAHGVEGAGHPVRKGHVPHQVVRSFCTGDTYLLRGWATAGPWTGPFLRLSYRAGPDSVLSETAGHQLGPAVKLWLKVRGRSVPEPLTVSYNPTTARYDLELWGYPGNDLHQHLEDKGKAALERGELLTRPDLLPGSFADFVDAARASRPVTEVATESVMHPVLALPIELAWCDLTRQFWDNRGGTNYHYEFGMKLRGWDRFLAAGALAYPYGGIGVAHYRTLFSSYAPYSGMQELGASSPAPGEEPGQPPRGHHEHGMSINQVELLVLKNDCAIGLHQHHDNQQAYMLLDGHGLMAVGDCCPRPSRLRCLEVRTLQPGDMVLVDRQQLHGFANTSDADAHLLVFGGVRPAEQTNGEAG